jgi:hypothetical protein
MDMESNLSLQYNFNVEIFLKCTKNCSNAARVNVAVSRARHHLFIVGNGAMLLHAPLWSSVVGAAALKVGGLRDLQHFCSLSPSPQATEDHNH